MTNQNNHISPEDINAEQASTTMHPNKHSSWKIILLVVFFALIIYAVWQIATTFDDGDPAALADILTNIDITYTLLSLAVVMAIFFVDALKYAIVNKISNGKYDYAFCINMGLMGKFYDNITPFNTGGQPYQVYMLTKRGYSGSNATAVPVLRYVTQLIVWILVSLVLYICNSSVLSDLSSGQLTTIKASTYIGLAVASLMPVAVILFSMFPKFSIKILEGIYKLLAKIRIINNAEKLRDKTVSFLENYSNIFKKVTKNVLGLAVMMIVNIVDYLLLLSLPYLVLLALGEATPGVQLWLDIITLNSYVIFSSSLIPTPGNSGAIELAYSMVFATVPMSSGILFWVVMIWRTLTYYIFIVIGLIESLVQLIHNRIIAHRAHSKN